jgi:CRP/FNR family transcriptional regulator/CRP/FNR family nitrogen fixation transcriptional regulator
VPALLNPAETQIPSAKPAAPAALERCELCEAFAIAASPVRAALTAGAEIFRQGDRAGMVYRVLSGAAISYRLLNDGRRQVTEFHVAGDFLGLEAGLEYRTTADALGGATVAAVRRADLARLAATDSGLARALWQMSVRAFQRSEDHALILARQGATERVAAFLLDYADRVGAADVLDLPMTRQDMADHLGLTIHTVSRTLSQLQDQGLIEARSTRHVRLLRRDLLERIRA